MNTLSHRILAILSALLAVATPVHADADPHQIADPLLAEAAMLTAGTPVQMVAAAAAPAPPNTAGTWSSLINWTPHIPVTAATLPDGRLLTFSASQRTTFPVGNEFTYAAVWDPATGAFTEINNYRHDMFCGGTVMLPDGRLVINGGRNTTTLSSIFDYRTNQWEALQSMNDPRWYNTSVALPGGSVFTVAGDGGETSAELWNAATGWRRLTGVDWNAVITQPGYITDWHPFAMLAPNGKLFHFGPTDQMNWVTTDGSGSRIPSGQNVPGSHYPKEGAWAMYDQGRVLVVGGGRNTTPNPLDPSTGTSATTTYKIDLNGTTPSVTTAAPMQFARQFANAVVLPNGEVMIIGGNTTGIKFSDSGAVLTPEIWNPTTGTWRSVANIAVARTYHSLALLLPNGTVWSGGGGLSGGAGDHRDAQIYTPPSLYNSSGSLATRPTITAAPTKIGPGNQFTVRATAGLTKFSFIRMSSQTHSVNTDLRYLSLPFTETSAGVYTLTGHANSNVMVPGYWMLFGLNSSGVHSVSKVIQVSLNPDVTLQNPGNQQSIQGENIQLPVSVSAPPAINLTYSATGLPTGLSVNPNTGIISGTVTSAPGDYAPTLSVTPSVGLTLTTSFDWSVLPPNPNEGKLRHEIWYDLPGNQITDLTENEIFPADFQDCERITSFEVPEDWDDNNAQRVRGYLKPTVTGTYRFWIASDDQSLLLISPGSNPANAVEIAGAPAWTESREWTKYPQQASDPITLEAGKRYYIEALMKENVGGDNLAVGWMRPGDSAITVIPAQYLSAYDPLAAPVAAWQFDETAWTPASGGVLEKTGNIPGIHGTAMGGASTSASTPALAGNPGTGRAGAFNGTGQFVSIPFDASLNPEDFTVSAWVNPLTATSTSQRGIVVSRKTVGSAIRGFGLYASADGKWNFFTGSAWSALVGPNIIANQWSHVSATFRTTSVTNGVRTGIRRIFINGILAAEDSGNYVPVTNAPLLIGASDLGGSTGLFMNGNIDEVRLHAEPFGTYDTVATMELRHRLNTSPSVTSPGPLANSRDSNVSQAIQAGDPNGDPLVFSATGLPDGLSISPSSGIISGTPGTVNTFTVTVTAMDPAGETGSTTFVWTIVDKLSVTPVSAPPAPAGGSVNLTANGSGGVNPLYRWNFGDGSPDTAFAPSASVTHSFPGPGRYLVTVTATDDSGSIITRSFHQAVHAPLTATRPTHSTPICHEQRVSGNSRVWNVNPDNDSVTVIDAVTRARLSEIPVGTSPRCIAVAPNGRIWVTNATSATLSIIDQDNLGILSTIQLPRGSRPYGLAFTPDGAAAYVTLEDTGRLLRLDPVSGVELANSDLGKNIRHLSISADSASVYVSRFITPRLPGEETGNITTTGKGGEVVAVDPATGTILRTLILNHSERPDTSVSARGIPNYLGSPVISPDGLSAWVPSKQDNIKRGGLRDGNDLNHDMSVRSIASRINLTTQSEDLPSRVDLDNAGVPSALVFDPWGVYAFVALEASRTVAVVDVWNHREILRFGAGRAPQGLAISPDGSTLFVHNFMDRSVTVHDISTLVSGISSPPPAPSVVPSIVTEKLPAQTLLGKKLFYDAKDNRLALHEYMSCAACHNDGGQDGRVWDLTGFGEGLRNTITLRGHGGNRQGPLHWSGNFDEVQDFENQIRDLAGGTGLISPGAPHSPLDNANAGRSPELDALAAYLGSLDKYGESPQRQADGNLTVAALAGERVFRAMDCASCHGGPEFTLSSAGNLQDIGTLKPSSGQRLGAPLTGINIPTLRGLWNSAPYLHDGSAATLEQAVTAHQGASIGATDLANLVTYLESIDDLPATAPANASPVAVADTAVTDEDTPLTLGVGEIVTPNDTDANGDTLMIIAAANPVSGTATFNANGTVTFTPTANHHGTTSFDYTVSDGVGGTATATVTIIVNSVPDAPVANNDTASTLQNKPLVLRHADIVSPNDTDADGDLLVISAVSNAINGSIALNPDGSVAFTPTTGFNGTAYFDYTVSDGSGRTATATVTITVTPITNYEEWLDSHGIVSSPDDDSDDDSIGDSIEYVIGGNPTNTMDASRLPSAEMVTIDRNGTLTEYLCFTYRRTDLANADSTAVISAEWTTNLSSGWVKANGTHGEVFQTADQPGENHDLVKVFIPRSASNTGVLLARLRVTINPPTE